MVIMASSGRRATTARPELDSNASADTAASSRRRTTARTNEGYTGCGDDALVARVDDVARSSDRHAGAGTGAARAWRGARAVRGGSGLVVSPAARRDQGA